MTLGSSPGTPGEVVPSEVVKFFAGDGMRLDLLHYAAAGDAPMRPVLLVHGAGVSAGLFTPPVATSLVSTLLAAGYDVWAENWRASIDLAPNQWTLDQAALYDHPRAVETMLRETGAETCQAIVHCQGSTSFMMSAVAGLVPEVTTILSNGVALHPVIPKQTLAKLRFSLPSLYRLVDYMDPQWGNHADTLMGLLIKAWVLGTHHECDNNVCRLTSFIHGTGRPTLWRHENLNQATHEWVKRAFGKVPTSFFEQIYKCVKAGHTIGVENLPSMPRDFGTGPRPQTDARMVFFAGTENICFLPDSQLKSFQYFDRIRPGYHGLHMLPGYGHLDPFIGELASRDVFPLMLAELEK
jgi:pimeloyl-ACP methyl ester carboxylesterase